MSEHSIPRRDFMRGAFASGAGLGLLSTAATAQDDYGAGAPPTSNEPKDYPLPPEGAKVPRRTLGRTGETIPIIFMGGSQKFDPKFDKMLHRAFKLGVDYIDTAQVYANGESQRTIAPFLQQVGRDKIWVTSKVVLKGSKATPENFKANLEKNLADLQTDYLNAFFMHMIDDEAMLEPDFIKMGDDLKKAGKTKYFGFSCHDGNVPELLEKAARVGGIDVIMFRYNFRQYGDAKLNKAIDAAHKAGIGLLAMKTQASVPEDIEKVVEFKSKNWTLAQAKLKSVWADERISGCVSQITNIQILMENTAAAMSPEHLTMQEFVQLNRLAALTAPYHCMGCKNICESRIAGKLRIADAMRYLMYAESYDDAETARLLYHALEPAERDFEQVDLSEATRACPQGIQIAERLARARAILTA